MLPSGSLACSVLSVVTDTGNLSVLLLNIVIVLLYSGCCSVVIKLSLHYQRYSLHDTTTAVRSAIICNDKIATSRSHTGTSPSHYFLYTVSATVMECMKLQWQSNMPVVSG